MNTRFWMVVDRDTGRPLATTQPFQGPSEPETVTVARSYLTDLALRAGFQPDYELWCTPRDTFAGHNLAYAIPELRETIRDTDTHGPVVVEVEA